MFLASQVYPEYSIVLYNAYLDATEEHHGYPLLDLPQDTNHGLRFRTNIFPNATPPFNVYSYVGDEARDIKLSHPAGAEDGRTQIALSYRFEL